MAYVLYTEDLEPITIVDLHPDFYNFLIAGNRARLPVPAPFVKIFSQEMDINAYKLMTVTVYAEKFIRRGVETYILFVTPDSETAALLLRATFLPGQRSELNRIKRLEFARGFVNAFIRPDR